MFIHSYYLKNIVKAQLSNLQEVIDFARFHPIVLLRREASQTTVEFIKANCARAISFNSQMGLMKFALQKVSVEGAYMEFGVFKGGSINFIARTIDPKIIQGFDSFEGLPEDWFNMPKEFFSLRGKIPKVRRNVRLHKGFFDSSIPEWLSRSEDRIAFAHIDCDVYSSTRVVLSELSSRLQEGTILVFDDYFNQPFWEHDSHLAFQEFLGGGEWACEYLAYSFKEVAVKLVKKHTGKAEAIGL